MNKKSSEKFGAFFSSYLWLREDDSDYYTENLAVLDRAGVPTHRRIYVSKTTPTVIALFKQSEMEKIRAEDRFIEFTPYGFDTPQITDDDVIPMQIGISTSISEAYSGKGVKVGVISAEGLIYDRYAKSLDGVEITDLPSIIPPETNSHPTAVISQIAGKEAEADGIKFFGIARDSQMYFASTRTSKGLYDAVEEMIRLGVAVINYSAGKLSDSYTDIDRQIDRLIRNSGILFVTASGNQLPMTSPGRAYNGITVGNAVTKEQPNTPLPRPWQVWCKSYDSCSGFNADGVHKPDLVAPGGWIGYVDRLGKANLNNFGTSFACPWVSGIASLLISAYQVPPSYLTVKAILLMSCQTDILSQTDDPYVSNGIRLRSGYGMVDAEKALDITKIASVFEGVTEESDEYSISGDVGDTMTAMLVFEKGEDQNGAILTIDGESYDANGQNTLLVKKRSSENVSLLSVYGKGKYKFSLVVFRRS